MRYICLEIEGLVFPVDTQEELETAQLAMANLGYDSAQVWYTPQATLAEAETAGFEGCYRIGLRAYRNISPKVLG